MKNKTYISIGLLVFILSTVIVFGHGKESFVEAEDIIDSKIPCGELTDDKVLLRDYHHMNQMHPGEVHEGLDKIIGGESFTGLRLMHMNMTRPFYCGKHETMAPSMMNVMMGRRARIIGTSCMQDRGTMTGHEMIGSYGLFYNVFYNNNSSNIFSDHLAKNKNK